MNDATIFWRMVLPDHAAAYSFDRVLSACGSRPTTVLMSMWRTAFLTRATRSTYTFFQSFRRYCIALGEISKLGGATLSFGVMEKLREGCLADISGSDWRQSICEVLERLHAENLRGSQNAVRRTNAHLYALNVVFKQFADYGVCDLFEAIPGLRRHHDGVQRVPTLAELSRDGVRANPIEPHTPIDKQIADAVELSRARLSELRRCLIEEFSAESEAFAIGQRWIGDTSLPNVAVVQRALGQLRRPDSRSPGAISGHLDQCFGPYPDLVLALTVRMVYAKHGGSFHLYKLPDVDQRMIGAAGGSEAVTRHLEASPLATSAASAILMTEAPLNVAVVSDLPVDPFVGKAKFGKKRISTIGARKMRAGGKQVFGIIEGKEADLHVSKVGELPTIDVLLRYKEMSEPIRRRARKRGDQQAANKLFIFPRGNRSNAGQIRTDIECFAGERWPSFLTRIADNPIIGGLPITRRMLRGTILQIAGHDGGDDLEPPRALAGHSQSGLAAHYLDTPWMRAQLDEQIRVFQDLFEASLLDGIATDKLPIAMSTLQKRRRLAVENGLSFYCGTSVSDMPEKLPRGPTCTPLNPCNTCPVRRFVPSEEGFIFLYLAGEALSNAENRMISSNPARWYEFWMPWHAVTIAYQNKILKSPYKLKFQRAKEMAQKRLSSGLLTLPEVF